MRAETRPELFFIYGIVVSVIVIVLFFTKINELGNMEDTVSEYYANELALVIDTLGMRGGWTSVPFSIKHLDDPEVSLSERSVTLQFQVTGEGASTGQRSEEILPLVRATEPQDPSEAPPGWVRFEQGYVVARDHEVWIEDRSCGSEALPEGQNITHGDAVRSTFITIIVNNPCMGLVEFERLEREDRFVQRIVVDQNLEAEVVILAR